MVKFGFLLDDKNIFYSIFSLYVHICVWTYSHIFPQTYSFQPEVASSMIGVRLGISEHLQDSKKIFNLQLDEEDKALINEVSEKGRDLLKVIGDCGDEYRR